MAQTTPNLSLTKQAQNEKNHNTVLNSNWDKVDAFAGSANTAIEKYRATTYTGDADSMPEGIYYCESTVSNLPSAAAYFVHCMPSKSNSTYAVQIAYQNQTAENIYIRRKRGGTYAGWQQLAMKIEVPTRTAYTNQGSYRVRASKFGSVVTIRFTEILSSVSMPTLDAEFRPQATEYGILTQSNNSAYATVSIGTDGAITLSGVSGSGYFYGNITYIV